MHVVATGTRRGAETFACDLVGALARQGVEQRVVVLHGEPDVQLDFAAAVERVVGNGRRIPGLGLDWARLRRLRRTVSAFAPDVLQLHGGEALKYAAVAPPRRGALVYRRIGSTAGRRLTGLRKAMHGRLMRKASAIVSVADAVRSETIREFGVDESRIFTIPNGVDRERLRARSTRTATRATLGIAPDVPVILSLGALTWEKDPLAQLEVGRRVRGRSPGAVHLFAGDGPLKSDLERAVIQAGDRESVWLLGSRDDVPDLLAATDVLLLASATEGMPAAAIEAGMAGVPVAAYAAQGIPEVVVNGSTGLLADPGDTAGLAQCVLRLITGTEGKAMGEEGKRRCEALFDIAPIARAYLDLYERVAS
ncbi:MAG: glycosyltransferase family 4 protein [Actinomycetota bacterium]|nr:glycosyltransferase family 4 protein [Actinomycetota bacterium]